LEIKYGQRSALAPLGPEAPGPGYLRKSVLSDGCVR